MKSISPFLILLGVVVICSAALTADSAFACGGAECSGKTEVQAESFDGGSGSASKAAAEAKSGCGDCESQAAAKKAIYAADGGSCDCPIHTAGKSGHYEVGDKVDCDVTLTDCCSKEYSLRASRQNSKAVVLAFYSARCPVIKAYNQRIVELAEDYGKKGITFLSVNSNVNESVAEIHQYKAQRSLNYPTLIDKDSRLANAFDAQVTPHIYVIDSDGILRYRGPVDDSQDPAKIKHNYLRTALDAVLDGGTVQQAEVDAFGCAIRRL